ncbi:MAG: hypothetical protein ACFCUJ_11225, partial [Thiotrichales bacterium]
MVKKATSPDPRPAHKPTDPKSDNGTDANDADAFSTRSRQDPWVTALAVFAVGLIVWALFLGSQDSPTPDLSQREVTTAAPPSLAFALEGSEARDLIRRAAQDNTLDL